MNEKFPVDAVQFAAKVDYPVVKTAVADGTAVWQIAATASFMTDAMINKLLALAGKGGKVTGYNVETFNADAKADDFYNKSVCALTINVENGTVPADPAREAAELLISGGDDFFTVYGGFTTAEANVLNAAAEFIHSQLAFIDRNAYTLCEIRRFMGLYPEVLRKLMDKFLAGDRNVDDAKALIAKVNSGIADKDAKVKAVLGSAAEFFRCVIRSNYNLAGKTALAFKLDPSFMAFFGEMSEKYVQAFPPERPFGVFFFYRNKISGFQIRFAPIARGGWRTVVPKPGNSPLDKFDAFNQAHCELFRENFVLANTQHKKNKDIYEGGSKMVTILENLDGADFKTTLWAAQRAIFEAFLALLLQDPNDIIEIGPDENMFDEMITYMGERGEAENYVLRSGIISGKEDTGINHKHYGVTSFGVYQYLIKTLKYLGITPETDDFSVILSGGPFGDVAGNMMKLLNDRNADGSYKLANLRMIAITDGPAAVYDPAGLDREEVSSLIHKAALDSFNPAKLTGEGAFMIWSAADADGMHRMAQVVNGKVTEKQITHNEFMQLFSNNIFREATVFVPGGGRPQTIHDGNWTNFLADGKPMVKAIVEGANSFTTPSARLKLQAAGIINVLDSSSNKCGVITSSYEIMSGILLEKDEFIANKEELVGELMNKLAACANKEADWLYKEFIARKSVPMTDLSNELGNTVNELKAALFDLFTAKPELLDDQLILDHLLPIFSNKFADRITRLPDLYRRAIGAAEAAGRIVYTPEDPAVAAIIKALGK
ncbi:MAG: hypothetical protein E7057_02440 [Lentisphaerae bacterium]|nr:hypothetical protein [Lentisphaerota bacterium]